MRGWSGRRPLAPELAPDFAAEPAPDFAAEPARNLAAAPDSQRGSDAIDGRDRPLADDDAVRALYRAHGDELYRFALRSLADRGAAEEAVQETFVRAWRAADRFDETLGSLRTWLFAILRNVVIDVGRRRASRPVFASGGMVDDYVDIANDDAIDRLLMAWQIEAALRCVSAEHRFVLVEVHTKGRSYDEVACELGVPVGTVKSRVYYGIRAMRLALEELGYTHVDA